jgi:hypothetical protein
VRFPKPAKRSPKPRKRVKRSVRPHAVRQTKRAAQERTLDAKWSDRVFTAWGSVCWLCYARPATDPMHLVSRRYKPTRWLLFNGRPGCRQCHDYYTAHPREWDVVVACRIGLVQWRELRALARSGEPVDLDAAARELAG